MVDYSKWDKLELISDDDDECHPNVDKASLHRWKKQAKMQKLEQERLEEEQERLEYSQVIKEKKEKEDELAAAGTSTKVEVEKLKNLLSELAKRESELKASLDKRDRLRKFNEENACHDGFSKTILNKGKKSDEPPKLTPEVEKSIKQSSISKVVKSSSSSASSKTTTTTLIHDPSSSLANAPSSSSSTVEPKHHDDDDDDVVDEKFGVKKPSQEEETQFRQELDKYVQKMEVIAHTLNSKTNYDEMYKYIGDHPEIVCEESVSYLLLHCSDAIKKGNFKESKQFLKTSQVVKYCMELGKDGIYLFFMRMRDPSARFSSVFESEMESYWQRIKEKILELQAHRLQEKQRKFDEMKKAGLPVPDKPEDIGSTDDEYYDANDGQEEEEEEEE